MEEAKVTVKYREQTRDGIEPREKTWVIRRKHLFALTDFLDWAQKNGKKTQKQRAVLEQKAKG